MAAPTARSSYMAMKRLSGVPASKGEAALVFSTRITAGAARMVRRVAPA